MKPHSIFLISLAAFVVFSSTAFADRAIKVSPKKKIGVERRIALVIGNSNYEDSPLKNPVNDAEDMASALNQLGFQVQLGRNMTRKEMHFAIRDFGNSLRKGGIGLFYFAGHGMQINGKNFLIPVGVDIKSEDEVEYEAMDAGLVLRKMENAHNLMNMVFLDACRNNPFHRSFRSSTKGLAQMDAPSGSLIVYATAPGSIAEDGKGRNGVFTKNLLAHLSTSGLEIAPMLRKVRVDVRKETNNDQTPWESSSLEGSFYFLPKGEKVKLAVKPPQKESPSTLAPSESSDSFDLDDVLMESELKLKKQEEKDLLFAKLVKIEKLDEQTVSAENKAKAWRGFITKYPSASPQLNEAKERAEGWEQIARLTPEKRIGRKPAPPNMVFVPAGKFIMGSDKESKDQFPPHEVYVDSFFMDIYEVTQEEYQKVMKSNPSRFVGENHPVEKVKWADANAYCENVNKRLPTEAEWERAARGGTTTRYYWGDKFDKSYVVKGTSSTLEVGSRKPNNFGLYDMTGNVAEWVNDWYHNSYYNDSPKENPKGPIKPRRFSKKVIRGGNRSNSNTKVTSSYRDAKGTKYQSSNVGFRCVKNTNPLLN